MKRAAATGQASPIKAAPYNTLGQQFAADDVLGPAALAEAQSFKQEFGGGLIQAATKLGLAREIDLVRSAATFLGASILDIGSTDAPNADQVRQAAQTLQLPISWLISVDALIWFDPEHKESVETDAGPTLNAALRDPTNPTLLEELARRQVAGLRLWVATGPMVDSVLTEISIGDQAPDPSQSHADLARLRELAEEAPVIEFVNGLFSQALDRNASDVHVEPGPSGFETRLRVDGVLTDRRTHSRSMFDSVVTRIKILSGMDIAERRLPQDGRQTIRVSGEEVDLRVSSLPATEGESVVIRLLRKKSELPDMQGLGLRGEILDAFRRIIELPNGLFLVTGPTGSGKSTTLYRALEHLNRGDTKIITIEDPVEYDLDGVNQVQAHSEIGLTFSNGLRAMLRQDPDIIMVGEIRDRETAEVAIQAALTGHLVFSTLHTNSASGAIERLVDLGVEPFLLSAALRGVLGQRLLRRICSSCRRPASADDTHLIAEMVKDVPLDPSLPAASGVFDAVGCEVCDGSGYKGRIGVFELVDVHRLVQSGLQGNIRDAMKLDVLRTFGYRTMLEDAFLKASQGETTLEEIGRVFGRRTVQRN